MVLPGQNEASTFPMRAVVKLTGLSPDVLRAWERRYDVVQPVRTPGGTRRYRESDIQRLQMLKAVVDAGHRIGDVARLSVEELTERLKAAPAVAETRLDDVIDALDRFDAPAAERIMSLQLAALGPVRFARNYALPLLQKMGDAWQGARMCVASEHLGSGILRSLLGTALRPTRVSLQSPPIVFVTPSGERHELGLLIAALTALGSGGNAVYIGPDLPANEIVNAAEQLDAAAVAFSVVGLDTVSAGKEVQSVRAQLPDRVEIWVGGAGATSLAEAPGIVAIGSLDELERRVGLLSFRSDAAASSDAEAD